MSKLSQMAKQLEVSLYRDAQSFEEYMDKTTLQQRLQQIAVTVSHKTRSDLNPQSFQERHPPPPQPPPLHHMQNPNPSVNRMGPNGMTMSSHSQNSHGMPPGNGYPDQRVASGSSRMLRDDPAISVQIRHKQQRLLLLHHAAKCPHEDGRCTVTPHCADMTRLWSHMEGCKDNQCSVPHCFSSRAIFRHYRKCREANCPACGPVRETVRRNRAPGSSSSRTGTSTGPMMNSLRNTMDQQQQQMDPMVNLVSNGTVHHSNTSASRNHPVDMPPLPNQQSMQSSSSQYSMIPQHHQQAPSSTPPPPQQQQAQPMSQPSQPYSNHAMTFASGGSQPQQQMPQHQQQPQQQPSAPSLSNESLSNARSQESASRQGNAPRSESKNQNIRYKQQRLLLLRHASRCQHEAGKCPVTPHCASMKQLWEHIAHCKDQSCTVQHCLSSRYVLSHYRRCKDPRCPTCGPVRETIRKTSHRDQENGSARSQGPNSFDNSTNNNDVASPQPGSMSPSASRRMAELSLYAAIQNVDSSHNQRMLLQSSL